MVHLVVIPGLGDNGRYTKFLMRKWEEKYNILPHVITFGWKGDAREFRTKLNKLETYVDDLLKEKKEVSVLGISAGASATVNIFLPRKNEIKHLVSVCGRLSDAENITLGLYPTRIDLSLFRESVKLCEKNLESLSQKDKERILTIKPFYDDIVPVRTMTIDGAKNVRINSIQHMISIYLALTWNSKTIADFLKT